MVVKFNRADHVKILLLTIIAYYEENCNFLFYFTHFEHNNVHH